MRVIVPMAGMGKRLRPHTLTTPKPLFPIAGKPIVQRLVEDIGKLKGGAKIDEIAFIIGPFGEAVEKQLRSIGEALGAKVTLAYQEKALGTAHAVYCAKELLKGEVVIAFADTLFKADFKLDQLAHGSDGVIWVNKVEDPKPFGVVTLDGEGYITGMVEKPETFVSDLAIIGIYYVREGERLAAEIKHLLDNDLKTKGEFQLTDALDGMRTKGARLKTASVEVWMDCGNKEAVLDTNRKVLSFLSPAELAVPASAKLTNAVVVPPCFIGEGAVITSSVVGPYTSIGRNTTVNESVIVESIVAERATIEGVVLGYAIVGNDAAAKRHPQSPNVGDFSQM